MGNTDCGRISGILAGIENLRRELDALEKEVRALCDAPAVSDVEENLPGDPCQPAPESPDLPSGQEVEECPVQEEPIDISLPDSEEFGTHLGSLADGGAVGVVRVVGAAASDEEEGSEADGSLQAEPVSGYAAVQEDMPEDAPVDLPEDLPEDMPVELPVELPEDLPVDLPEDMPAVMVVDDSAEPVKSADAFEPVGIVGIVKSAESVEPAEEQPKGKAVMDSVKAGKAVLDVMAEKQAWRTDRPGSPIRNIISAISLAERALLINVLFGGDAKLFQDTVAVLNAMGSLDEAVSYICANFPGWNLSSDTVYCLMMAVRRKLK